LPPGGWSRMRIDALVAIVYPARRRIAIVTPSGRSSRAPLRIPVDMFVRGLR